MNQLSADFAKSLGVTEGAHLTLVPVGKLIRGEWHYDRAAKHGEYRYADVTVDAADYLFEGVELAPDVRLRDVLVLTQRHIDLLEPIISNWCREIVDEGLKNIKPWTGEYATDGIEYLELYQHVEVEPKLQDEKLSVLSIGRRLRFHGIGFELREQHDFYEKGSRISWAIEYTPVNELADIPLKVSPTVTNLG